MLAEFRALQVEQKAVKDQIVPPPSPRANCSLTVHPTKDELLLFGGERYDGKKNWFYADLFRYTPKRNEWKQIFSPTSPPPRSSHQAVAVPTAGGSLFVFGGEFSSTNRAYMPLPTVRMSSPLLRALGLRILYPGSFSHSRTPSFSHRLATESQFHHYRDFWCLDLTTWQWEQITAKGCPSARSGHRMAHVRDQLIVFGGFFDNLREVKYYNDLHIFDLSLYKWTRVTPEPGAPVPSPRSGFQLAPDPAGGTGGAGCVLLYGGYFKKQVKMQQFDSHKDKSQVDELTDTGIEYRDLWSFDLGTKTWDTLKKSGTPPSSRSGFCMALHKRRLVVFGGVHDEDTPDGEGLISQFYNDLHSYNLDAGKWHDMTVSTSKKGAGSGNAGGGKKAAAGKGIEKEEVAGGGEDDSDAAELLLDGGGRRRNRNRRGGDGDDDDDALQGSGATSASTPGAGTSSEKPAPTEEASAVGVDGAEAWKGGGAAAGPCARMNSTVALRGNSLYVYGGLVEPEDASELTLSDLWCLDLAKMDGWSCLYEGEAIEKSLAREEDSEDDSDGDGEEESEEESEEDSDEEKSDDVGSNAGETDEAMPRAALSEIS
jgi:N-acetylneuraminic acid mutarotase